MIEKMENMNESKRERDSEIGVRSSGSDRDFLKPWAEKVNDTCQELSQ
jgi:hypothetical protein